VKYIDKVGVNTTATNSLDTEIQFINPHNAVGKNKTWKTKFFHENMAISFVIVGVLIMISFIFIFFHTTGFDSSLKADTEIISRYGDIVGGVTGSIWALAGVILFYLALESQKESYALNQLSLNKQVDALNVQIQEFKTQGRAFERTANAQEATSERILDQIILSKKIAELESISTLADVNSNLARIETDPEIVTEYKMRAKDYIDELEIKLRNF